MTFSVRLPRLTLIVRVEDLVVYVVLVEEVESHEPWEEDLVELLMSLEYHRFEVAD